jgi:hypothetical protein
MALRTVPLAEQIPFDNTITGFTAENVQDAIDEIALPSASKLLSFYTRYCCGLLANLDLNCFHAIDCDALPLTTTRQTIDIGELT